MGHDDGRQSFRIVDSRRQGQVTRNHLPVRGGIGDGFDVSESDALEFRPGAEELVQRVRLGIQDVIGAGVNVAAGEDQQFAFIDTGIDHAQKMLFGERLVQRSHQSLHVI